MPVKPLLAFRALGLLALGLAALGGCSSSPSNGPNADPCKTSSDCTRCPTAPGCKGAVNLGAKHVDVEISPPAASPYVRTHKLDVSLAADAVLDLLVPQPAEYQVSVFDAAGNRIDASLTLKGKPRIPGRELELTSELRANAVRSPSLRLLEGVYDALVTPLDRAQPGLQATFMVRSPAGDTIKKEFRFPEYRKMYGEVTWSLARDHKITGATVTAYSSLTGLPSTATVSGERGAYAVLLPATEDTTFKLVATLPPEAQPAWSYEEIVAVGRELSREKNIPLEPTSAEIRGNARIWIGGFGDGFVPIAGATVTLTATAAEGLTTRVFKVQATTDPEGYVTIRDSTGNRELRLLKGRYAVEIEPAIDSRFARTSTVIDLTRIGPIDVLNRQLFVPLRTSVDGSIRTSQGRAVTYARLSFQPLEGSARPVDGTSDDHGDFDVALAPGKYLLTVSPSGVNASDDLPPVSVQMIDIARGVARHSLGILTLPRGGLIQGSIRGQDTGAPVANAKVEFFHEVAGRVVSLGSTRTDAAGKLAIVLPEPGS